MINFNFQEFRIIGSDRAFVKFINTVACMLNIAVVMAQIAKLHS